MIGGTELGLGQCLTLAVMQCSSFIVLICEQNIMTLKEKVTLRMKALGFASLALSTAILVFGVGLLAL